MILDNRDVQQLPEFFARKQALSHWRVGFEPCPQNSKSAPGAKNIGSLAIRHIMTNLNYPKMLSGITTGPVLHATA